MRKSSDLKGKILFLSANTSRKATSLKYKNPSFQISHNESITDTMMSSFEHLNFSTEEKKNLSRTHRKLLNSYRRINLFSLKLDAQKLINEINHSKQTHIKIEANDYGAYICLAALYSGNLPADKKIEFILENAPLALFPKSLLKSEPTSNKHKITFRLNNDCWIRPFKSLYKNQSIKFSVSKFTDKADQKAA